MCRVGSVDHFKSQGMALNDRRTLKVKRFNLKSLASDSLNQTLACMCYAVEFFKKRQSTFYILKKRANNFDGQDSRIQPLNCSISACMAH